VSRARDFEPPETFGRLVMMGRQKAEAERGDLWNCLDRATEWGSYEEGLLIVSWWELEPHERQAVLCAGCQSRVRLWALRRDLRKGLAGLMRSMRVAYRREKKAVQA